MSLEETTGSNVFPYVDIVYVGWFFELFGLDLPLEYCENRYMSCSRSYLLNCWFFYGLCRCSFNNMVYTSPQIIILFTIDLPRGIWNVTEVAETIPIKDVFFPISETRQWNKSFILWICKIMESTDLKQKHMDFHYMNYVMFTHNCLIHRDKYHLWKTTERGVKTSYFFLKLNLAHSQVSYFSLSCPSALLCLFSFHPIFHILLIQRGQCNCIFGWLVQPDLHSCHYVWHAVSSCQHSLAQASSFNARNLPQSSSNLPAAGDACQSRTWLSSWLHFFPPL